MELAAIKFLIRKGANITLKNGAGYTPLYIAIEERNFEATKYLLDIGAEINKDVLNTIKILKPKIVINLYPVKDKKIVKEIVKSIKDIDIKTKVIIEIDKN